MFGLKVTFFLGACALKVNSVAYWTVSLMSWFGNQSNFQWLGGRRTDFCFDYSRVEIILGFWIAKRIFAQGDRNQVTLEIMRLLLNLIIDLIANYIFPIMDQIGAEQDGY